MNHFKWQAAASATLPVITMGMLGLTTALAQAEVVSGATADSDKAEGVTEIVISGTASRVKGYEAPTPTTVLDAETFSAQAKLGAVEYLNNIPSMTPMYQVGGGTSLGLNKPNFRGMGPVRTLVLIDGNRVGYTDPLGGVDLNIMPTSLLQSIEVVSGGASAGWGSDAVAGVMNFHLNNTLQGVKGNFQCGESQYGDNQQCGGGIGLGTSLFNDKLHVVVAGDFLSNAGVRNAPNSRDWAAKNTAYVLNNSYAPGNGQYQFLLSDNACYGALSSSGVISTGPLRGTTFNAQGQPEQFVFGTNTGPTANQLMTGGTCEGFYSRYSTSQTPALYRTNEYLRLTYDISDSASVYGEALYAHSSASILATPNYDLNGVAISINNAYLPASVRARMVTAGITSFQLGRWLPEIAPSGVASRNSLNESETAVRRYVVGGKGKIVGSWTWDAHAQYSRAEYQYSLNGSRNNAKYLRSVNSEVDPVTGLPRCRTNPGQVADPACVPVNLFGAGTVSRAAADYFSGTATGDAFYTQSAGALNIQGELLRLPAGAISVAGGLETRKEKLSVTVDAVQAAGGWRSNALNNESGNYTVNEGYLETVVPILKDKAFAKNFDLNAAGRITNYSTSGQVKTWKAGLNYAPFESGVLRFRGTVSVDIRAPTLHELYSLRTQIATGLVFDPVFGGAQQNTGPQFTGGNTKLIPEVAHTKVYGVVFTPAFWGLDGLKLSADYYDIKITNGIVSLNAQQTVDTCALGVASVCAGVIRDPLTNRITSIFSQIYNAQGLENQGVDLEATYGRVLSSWFDGVPGKLTLNALATFVNKETTQTGTTVLNNVGLRTDAMTLVGVPKWNGILSAQYDVNAWMFYLQMEYISGLKNTFTVDPWRFQSNDIPSYHVFNSTVQYRLNDNLKVYGGVDNVLNVAFPNNAGPSTQPFSGVGSASFYDRVGRRFKLGIRYSFD
jgi:outer membrane receptor protein involved in Fe transport